MSDLLIAEPDVKNTKAKPAKGEESSAPAPTTKRSRATAETMAAKQRDISVSEFFAKNRHLLGFDNPRKALLTTVKEAVDNSLDACEEAGTLPDIVVVIEDIAGIPASKKESPNEGDGGKKPKVAQSSRYRITVVDNGPGIVRKQVEHIFGRLLYGSKFHRLKMSRGQQGIGISAAGMYGLITTGKPMVIHTRPDPKKPAHHIELAMNTKTNRAEVTVDEETDDFPIARLAPLTKGSVQLAREGQFLNPDVFKTGTSVAIELEGKYQKGRGSVDEFLELTAIANPHARITFIPPSKVSEDEPEEELLPKRGKKKEEFGVAPGESAPQAVAPPPPPAKDAPLDITLKTIEQDGVMLFPRAVSELPPETKEIQPHPRGVELGMLLQMLKESEAEQPGYTLYNFLQDKFSRVSSATAKELCEAIKVTSRTKVADIEPAAAEKLFRELQDAKLPPPPTDCLAPIGVRQLLAGMLKGVQAEFYAASSREPDVYRGRPFQIEAAIAFGGALPGDESARVIRFANRVPLLFQQSACSSFKAVAETNWRNYDLQHPRGALPVGPLVIMIHMASVWVPFTSESKEAIADYDEIRKEMKLALMECGRKLGTYLRKRAKMKREGERRDIFERYIGEIAQAINALNGEDTKKLYEALKAQAKKRTAIADLELDEEGKAVKDSDPADQEGVIVVESAATGPMARGGTDDVPGATASKAEAAALKVAGMDEDDAQRTRARAKVAKELGEKRRAADQPTLVDLPQKTKSVPSAKAAPRSAPAGDAKAKSPGPPPATAKTSAAPTPTPSGKLRMRMVNGKLVRVDDQGNLFK